MREVLERLKKYARQSDGIEIKKAGSFRGGKSGAVAVVTVVDKNTYLARTETSWTWMRRCSALTLPGSLFPRSRAYTLI